MEPVLCNRSYPNKAPPTPCVKAQLVKRLKREWLSHWLSNRLNVNIIMDIIRFIPETLPPLSKSAPLKMFSHPNFSCCMQKKKPTTNITLTFDAKKFLISFQIEKKRL